MSTDTVVEISADDLPIDFDTAEAPGGGGGGASVQKPEKGKDGDGAEDAVTALKRQLEDLRAETQRERAARERAESEAREARDRANKASSETLQSQIETVSGAMASAKAEADRAQRDYKSALETADYEAAAKAQRVLAEAVADMRRLEDGKHELELQKKRRESDADKPGSRRPSNLDEAIDGIMSASSSKAQEYLRSNRSKITSDRHLNRIMAAHQLAVNSDIAPDSDEYFKFLDRQMDWADARANPAPKVARPSSVAAPVSRDTAASGGDLTGSKMRLSPAQVSAAKAFGMTPMQYAQHLDSIQKTRNGNNKSMVRFTKDGTVS